MLIAFATVSGAAVVIAICFVSGYWTATARMPLFGGRATTSFAGATDFVKYC
jgi:hypothetical protein